MRELERADAERTRDAQQRRTARAAKAVAHERRAHLDLEEHAQHFLAAAADGGEFGEARPPTS